MRMVFSPVRSRGIAGRGIHMAETIEHFPFLPDKAYFGELRRPWKIATFAAGMLWLFYGAVEYDVSDWDIGVSIIMGGLTYLFAPWSVTTIYRSLRFRPSRWPLRAAAAFLPALLAVDWSYWLYHTAVGNTMLRWENFKTSMALYFLCGILWCYRGPASRLVKALFEQGRKR